jgi:hypothetical protein
MCVSAVSMCCCVEEAIDTPQCLSVLLHDVCLVVEDVAPTPHAEYNRLEQYSVPVGQRVHPMLDYMREMMCLPVIASSSHSFTPLLLSLLCVVSFIP